MYSRRALFLSFCAVIATGCSRPSADAIAPEPAGILPSEDALVVPESVEIQGHRGARGLRPENTLPAFEAALDLQVDTLELDLHFTRDGEVVVWHDPYLFAGLCRHADAATAATAAPPPHREGRPSTKPLTEPDQTPDLDSTPPLHPDLALANLTRRQLQGIRCDRTGAYGDRFPRQEARPGTLAQEYRIITLAEVFEFVARYANSPEKSEAQRANASAVRFNIETKRVARHPNLIGDGFDGVSIGAFEKAILATIDRFGLVERTTIQSFDHRSLWAIAATGAKVELAALESERGPDTFESMRTRGATIWSPRDQLVTSASLAAARSAGLRVIPWTVNEADRMAELVDLGVDGIITDYPDLLRH